MSSMLHHASRHAYPTLGAHNGTSTGKALYKQASVQGRLLLRCRQWATALEQELEN